MPQMDFDLNLLAVFSALFRSRSMTRAARMLGIAPSTMSERLKALRALYGDPLFFSDGRSLSPTALAEALHPQVVEALAACRRAAPQGAADVRSVVIAMSDDFEITIGRRLVDALSRCEPRIAPVLRQTNAFLVEEMLLSHAAQFAVTGGGTHGNAVARETFGFHLDCCLYESDDGAPLTLEAFAARPHVVVHYGGASGVAHGKLWRLGIKRRMDVMTSHYGCVPELLCGTARVALVPVTVAEIFMRGNPRLACCRIPFEATTDPVELSYRQDLAMQGDMGRCADVLREVLRSVRWEVLPEEVMRARRP